MKNNLFHALLPTLFAVCLCLDVRAQSIERDLLRCENLLLAGRLQSAIAKTDSALGSYTVSNKKPLPQRLQVRAAVIKASAYNRLMLYPKALQALEQVAAGLPNLNPCDTLYLAAQLAKANALHYLGQTLRAKTLVESLKVDACSPHQGLIFAEYYEYWGMYHGLSRRLNLAWQFFDKAFQVRTQYGKRYPLQLATGHKWLALTYSEQGNYPKAFEQLDKALALAKKHQGSDYLLASIYFSYAGVYGYAGDYQTAYHYYEQTERLMRDMLEDVPSFQIDLHLYMANALRRLRDLTGTKKMLEKAIALMEQWHNTINPADQSIFWTNVGLLYRDEHKYAEARSIFSKSAATAKAHLDSVPGACYALMHAYDQMAQTYAAEEQYAAAIAVYDTLFAVLNPLLGADNPSLTQPIGNYATVLESAGKKNESVEVGRQGLKILKAEDNDLFDQWLSPLEASIILWNKADSYENNYLTSGATSYLDSALSDYSRYLRFLDYLRSSFRREGSKLDLGTENHVAYQKVLELLMQKSPRDPDYPTIFEVMEKSRSLILLGAVNQHKESGLGLPPVLAQREKHLKSRLSAADLAHFTALSNPQLFNAREKKETEAELFAANEAFFQFRDSFKREHPVYYNACYETKVMSLPALKSDLNRYGQCLLEYFVGDEVVFILVITPQMTRVVQIPKDFPLEQLVLDFRQSATAFFTDPEQFGEKYDSLNQVYALAAHTLYQKLLAPVDSLLGDTIVIVPDGILASLPFEALLTGPAPDTIRNFAALPYWVKQRNISYAFSATLLRDMRDRPAHGRPKHRFFGVAPSFRGDTLKTKRSSRKFDPLLYNIPEVDTIRKLLGGRTLTGLKATKAQFLLENPSCRMLHFSTHAKSDAQVGDLSYLVFQETKDTTDSELMFVREIYNLLIDADLVTLSACETGIGQFLSGEGIISLARAFAYAGTRSIVTTLWSVNDAKTKDLMVAFYAGIKDGQSKNTALTHAKRAYIESAGKSGAHPFYWAGFVGIGDMGRLF